MPDDTYYDDLGKIEITYAGLRDTAVNVFWFACDAIAGAALDALEALAESWYTAWWDAIKANTSDLLMLTSCVASDWTSADGLSGIYNGSDTGSNDGDPVQAQVAALINWETNGRYRGGHPRTYVPGIIASDLENNQNLSDDAAASLASAMGTFLTTVNDLTFDDDSVTLVLYHRGPTATHPDRIAQGVKPIIGGVVPTQLATQRRRVRRAGHLR